MMKKYDKKFEEDRILHLVARDLPDEGSGLLEVLYLLMPERSKTTVKSLLRNGQVRVGQSVTTQFDHKVRTGDTIDVNLTREWPVFRNSRLKIVYEDDHILVVDKGYGLLSVAADTKRDGTAYSILRDYVKTVNPQQKIFIVHRLDQHTSGLMVFAKTVQAKEELQHNWNNMVLERKYIAIVEGCPAENEGVISNYLSENSRHIVYQTDKPVDGAQHAVTRWRRLRNRGKYAMLEVSLDTGRKNQIRVHMQGIGHPIAGDRKYGAATSPIRRLALHAATLRFVHPVTRRDMNFSLPIPASFNKLV